MKVLGSILAVLVVIGLIVAYPVALTSSRRVVTISVEDKERGSGHGDHKTATLVFAKDETYEVADSVLAAHFNSSDTYRKLHRGHTYRCKVQGWRVPFLSRYRNIIECS